jgi:hypothetical protein
MMTPLHAEKFIQLMFISCTNKVGKIIGGHRADSGFDAIHPVTIPHWFNPFLLVRGMIALPLFCTTECQHKPSPFVSVSNIYFMGVGLGLSQRKKIPNTKQTDRTRPARRRASSGSSGRIGSIVPCIARRGNGSSSGRAMGCDRLG